MPKLQFAKDEQYGDWKLLSPLSGGGNSFVWMAKHVSTGEEKVIKLLNKDHTTARNRFADEVNILKSNQHIAGVMKVLDASGLTPQNRVFWYVMEKGETLEHHLQGADPSRIVRAVAQLAGTLARLHEDGVAHRDLKAQNLFVFGEEFVIGDFGLVDFPDKQDLTISSDPLGPRWTMDPEMRKNPRTADGKKADVFSLAKTLWILLTGVEKGFEGQYNPEGSIGIRHYQPAMFNAYLDKLLVRATENDPKHRPSMKEFAAGLSEWVTLNDHFEKQNKVNWVEVQSKLFPTSLPEHVVWTDSQAITSILNIVSGIEYVNHMFFPGGGGMDLRSARWAQEPGFIELDMGGLTYLMKPKELTFESFAADSEWNYFRLETEKADPIFESGARDSEYIVETGAGGNYITRDDFDAFYEENGYDHEEWRKVSRYYGGGSFVIFQKTSSYNFTPGTYDGRHALVDGPAFREYIQLLVDMDYRVVYGEGEERLWKYFHNGPMPEMAEFLKIRKKLNT
jgi:serine/threonine-protein kinase